MLASRIEVILRSLIRRNVSVSSENAGKRDGIKKIHDKRKLKTGCMKSVQVRNLNLFVLLWNQIHERSSKCLVKILKNVSSLNFNWSLFRFAPSCILATLSSESENPYPF